MICLAIFLFAFSNIRNDLNSEHFNRGNSEVVDSTDVDSSLLWPGGIVPYVIEDDLLRSNKARRLINSAMLSFHRYSCVRFKYKTNEKNYVKIFKGRGCYTMIGRHKGEQPLSLGDDCLHLGTIIHELNHVLGFYHEHNRPDRDEYIKVNWKNIESDKRSQFSKNLPYQVRPFNEFDYNSIMLYGETLFSKNGHSKTIEATKPGVRLDEIDNKPGLSKSDIARINNLYKCTKIWID
ncbi:astacin-like metalloprotease toxin 5 [Centruroides sculpturatus]|uniref:astacin-like metalloprotease toxin 5 n=1 Tax=Centruroides sculpturatus TaxID=218467 RepID=UPI000C6E677E|nr:astacin-like metalloprotease toxin 5 [Centruroides sculpturatus]XP_023229244.1 astacin-like metalloprotease toxin 5 [Centruroides sculpturatus]